MTRLISTMLGHEYILQAPEASLTSMYVYQPKVPACMCITRIRSIFNEYSILLSEFRLFFLELTYRGSGITIQ